MAAEKDIIVALELATTTIRAIAGQRMADGSMQVLAYAEENAANCIRKGIIDNIDKTTQAISRVLGQIGLQIGHTISRIYIGLSGQSLHSVPNCIKRAFTEKTHISNEMIDQLMDTNRGIVYTDSKILEVIPQEYNVGNRAVSDIVGMQIEQLEANFLNIIARSSLTENIEKCIQATDYEIAELLITPQILGNTILSASEKRSGCALVDIGADTTAISVYTNNILRKLIVLPIGSNNATIDLAKTLTITTEPEEAENLKIKYGRAWIENGESAKNNVISISHDRSTTEHEICSTIEARYEEIILNIWAQIKEYKDKLTSGIIVTGGGAQIKHFDEAFKNITKSNKQIRIVKGLPSDISITPSITLSDNGRTNGILSLLLHGNQNCIVQEEAAPIISTHEPEPIESTPVVVEEEPVGGEIAEEATEQEKNKKKRKSIWQILKDALEEDN
jgi:cell division protein FtsA